MPTIRSSDALPLFMASAVLAAVLGAGSTTLAQQQRPNVVLVMTDDQGYGDLACHGNPYLKTTHIDELYGEAIRFTNFHVDPTCSETRSALMTGRYSSRVGVWHTIMGRSLLRRDEVTMANVFSDSGYRTAVFGKWHLGDNYPFRPQDRGFQHTLVNGGGGVTQTPDYWGNDYFDDTYWLNGTPTKFTGYCTDVFFSNALKFIEENRERPFFVYIPTNAAHGPFLVDDKYSKPYRDLGVETSRAAFYGMITNIDENMGRLRARLAELDLDDRTIVIFMTDNGSARGYDQRTNEGYNAGLRAAKGSQYDGGHRVPFFIHWPGHYEGGRDVDHVAAHFDLLPTFIDVCGLHPPAGVRFDGRSLRPLLRGEDGWPQRTLLVHSQRIDRPEKWRKCAVMTDRWRLIDGKQLYDIVADRGQKRDVAADYPQVVSRLRQEYEDWWSDISTRFDEDCEIVLGSDKENPSRLTAHDWHPGNQGVPWNQGAIRKAPFANGYWSIDVERDGHYEFTLRQQPTEAEFVMSADTARLKIEGADQSQPVPEGATGVTFDVELKKGSTQLRTWLTDADGRSRGAFFIYVRRVAN